MPLSEQRLQHVLNSPTGPLGRRLALRGVQAETTAKSLATSEGLVRTGDYRDSIRWRLLHPLALELLSDVPYAGYLERGTDPHPIPGPTDGSGMWWRRKANHRDGWVEQGFNVQLVSHPGNKGYGILRKAIRAAFGRL